QGWSDGGSNLHRSSLHVLHGHLDRILSQVGPPGAMIPAMRLLPSASLAVRAIAPFAAAQPFTVGTAKAERVQKATGFIEVPAAADPATSIPVIVLHGARPGPVLAIASGSHGTEYASIIAVEKLIGVLNPAEISG